MPSSSFPDEISTMPYMHSPQVSGLRFEDSSPHRASVRDSSLGTTGRARATAGPTEEGARAPRAAHAPSRRTLLHPSLHTPSHPRDFTRRRGLALALAGVLTGVLAGCQSAPSGGGGAGNALTKVTIGIGGQPLLPYLPTTLAQQLGYHGRGPEAVAWASRLTFAGLLLLATCTSALFLVLRVATHNALVPYLVGGVLAWYLLCWFVLPLWARIRYTSQD
ncbi:DUF6328 family protein [Streptomyces sp. NPDC058612]|uniref:DUF6328 family protein n=1 Tax=Streptomyces sp. NPDC058612 TaxID=3346555 RepID=UPI0036668115